MSRHTPKTPRTVFRATVAVAKPPFVDGAPVEHRELGLYSSLDAALAWIRSPEFAELFDEEEDETPLYVRVTEQALDVGLMSDESYRSHALVAPSGEVLERTACGDGQRPWAGRDPATYIWKRGDIAATVVGDRYRIGVVLAPPPSIGSVKKQPDYDFTQMEDASLLGFAGDFDHTHPSNARMFEPLAPISDDLRRRLEKRLREYPVDE